ncbi:membrane protein [Chania multitudinisentens RB-25]|uniref:Membrane protein n=1 Tax=Chania multitudinisentens RB-25 TaxID=1441930 RepID=W0LDX7_9GAMM|nr:YbjC family protein [Chania multitudinisentens]AHG21911.1 membrane protein [Chania multitudinisentens RB-25]
MLSFGNLPRSVLVLEGLGMVLLVLSYLSIHNYVHLPGPLASQQAAIGMIFLGVTLMLPAVVYLVWRLVQGFNPLIREQQPPENTQRNPSPADKKDPGSQE